MNSFKLNIKLTQLVTAEKGFRLVNLTFKLLPIGGFYQI